jgi:hypothetical protein
MKYPYLMQAAALAAVVGAGGVLAQPTPSGPTSPSGPSTPTVTDVAPLPAEERSSAGAIVLENSLVRAQRENAFQRSAAQTGVTSVGRGVLRATMKAQAQAELAQAREAEAIKLHEHGAGSLTPK